MAELDAAVQLKLIEIAQSTANTTAQDMSFPSQEDEADFWIKKFGDLYKKLVKAITE